MKGGGGAAAAPARPKGEHFNENIRKGSELKYPPEDFFVEGTQIIRGRTGQHSPPSRSHSARRALCDREGSS